MERIAPKVTDGTERLPLVGAHNTLGGIFHYQQVMGLSNGHDFVHVAGNTRIMDGRDHSSPFGDGRLDGGRIDILRIGQDINEHELRAHENKGRRRARKCEARQDHFVSRLKIAEHSSHLECRCSTSGQQNFIGTEAFFQPRLTFLREGAITADLTVILHRFTHIVKLRANIGRDVKVNH